jgi:uncharacterized protein (TIGR03790 family)
MTAFASIFRTVALLLVLASPGLLAFDRHAEATLVVFNTNDPESRSLAEYYAERRGIPAAQVVGLDCPLTEVISRADFRRKIKMPLRAKLVSEGWWRLSGRTVVDTSIRFVAVMRGVPLKIEPDPEIPPAKSDRRMPSAIAARNDASVDSELACMGLDDAPVAGIVENPYFGRFTPILEESVYPGLLLVSRLDAPTASIVRAMIDDAIMVEREGLWGWAYVDGRDITSGGYSEGDLWMRRIVELLRRNGVPTIFDNQPSTFLPQFPVTDAAFYFGWYAGDLNGPFAGEGFSFVPGAIAVHLHSYSAGTLRSTTMNWCGPLLARGAAATLGNVYEPYLSLTANLDVFLDRLVSGLTLAESGYMSQRAVSWMGVVLGDPLYRPFKAWHTFHDPRNKPFNPWRHFRRVTLANNQNALNAIIPLHDAAQKTRNSMFLEALGTAQADAGHPGAAVQTFEDAMRITEDPRIRVRLGMEIANARGARQPVTSATPVPVDPMPSGGEGAPPDSPVLKPAPTPPPMPSEIPNLPFPDL